MRDSGDGADRAGRVQPGLRLWTAALATLVLLGLLLHAHGGDLNSLRSWAEDVPCGTRVATEKKRLTQTPAPALTVISAPCFGTAMTVDAGGEHHPGKGKLYYDDAYDHCSDEISDSEGEDLCSTRHIALWDENVLRESEGPHSEGHASVQTRTQAGFFPAAAAGQMETRATKPDYETVFTNAKAGMDDVDKDYVKRVVYEMSKDSNFFKNEQRKNEENARRNQELKQKLEALSPSELDVAQKWADKYMAEKERTRDLSRTFVHVDMDMFFAAVEQMHCPQLREVPFAIGGLGMISTANYVARKYGVRSAMPGFIGKELCAKPAPGSRLEASKLVFVKPDFTKYVAISEQVKALLKEHFDPYLQSGGIDEAYLDVTEYMRTHAKTPVEVAEEIRACIREATYSWPGAAREVSGLTCSCGVAPNRRLAKICSDINKPDGQYVLEASREHILDFVSSLPIRKVGGIGKVTERMLHEVFGVVTCGDVGRRRGGMWCLLHRGTSEFMLSVALGLGGCESHEQVEHAGHERKGISCERTFRAMSSPKDLEAKAEELARALAEDMQQQGFQGKTLTLKLKPVSFQTFTRAVTLGSHTADVETMMSGALALLRKEFPLKIRLMGLRMSNLLQHGSSVCPLPPSQTTLRDFFGSGTRAPGCEDRIDQRWDACKRKQADVDVDAAGGAREQALEGLAPSSEQAIARLCCLGCAREDAEMALVHCKGNVEKAGDYLLSQRGCGMLQQDATFGLSRPSASLLQHDGDNATLGLSCHQQDAPASSVCTTAPSALSSPVKHVSSEEMKHVSQELTPGTTPPSGAQGCLASVPHARTFAAEHEAFAAPQSAAAPESEQLSSHDRDGEHPSCQTGATRANASYEHVQDLRQVSNDVLAELPKELQEEIKAEMARLARPSCSDWQGSRRPRARLAPPSSSQPALGRMSARGSPAANESIQRFFCKLERAAAPQDGQVAAGYADGGGGGGGGGGALQNMSGVDVGARAKRTGEEGLGAGAAAASSKSNESRRHKRTRNIRSFFQHHPP